MQWGEECERLDGRSHVHFTHAMGIPGALSCYCSLRAAESQMLSLSVKLDLYLRRLQF
jgi:hypothetical protein